MKGDLSPSKRSSFWKSKRVFFVTPQILENDIQSGDFLPMFLVFLLIFCCVFLFLYFTLSFEDSFVDLERYPNMGLILKQPHFYFWYNENAIALEPSSKWSQAPKTVVLCAS